MNDIHRIEADLRGIRTDLHALQTDLQAVSDTLEQLRREQQSRPPLDMPFFLGTVTFGVLLLLVLLRG